MDHPRQVLVVARSRSLADRLVGWLEEDGRGATLATTFPSAKAQLTRAPDLLVTELKLGEYNGLHLALKAEAAGVPVIVIGPPDPVLQKDAESFHATYLTTLTRTELLEAVTTLLSAPPAALPVPRLHMPVTTVGAEAELTWRAFCDSGSSQNVLGRTPLPN